MTNLPTNPTREQILDRYWIEFLLHVKHYNDDLRDKWREIANDPVKSATVDLDTEPHTYLTPSTVEFWRWYADFKLESPRAS